MTLFATSKLAAWLGADYYEPMSDALGNDRVMMTLYVASNVMLTISLVAIGVTLYLHRNRNDNFIVMLRGHFALIFLIGAVYCGLENVTMFWAVYRLEVVVRALTAAIVTSTAVYTVVGAVRNR